MTRHDELYLEQIKFIIESSKSCVGFLDFLNRRGRILTLPSAGRGAVFGDLSLGGDGEDPGQYCDTAQGGQQGGGVAAQYRGHGEGEHQLNRA